MIEQLKEIIKKSKLSEEDKKFWEERIKNMPEEMIPVLEILFQSSEKNITLVTELTKEKIAAAGDPEKLEKILKKEKELLQKSLE